VARLPAREIIPTRSELIELKRRIVLSETGYGLLKKKRDALMLELFKAIKKAKDARRELDEAYALAQEKMALAQATDGIARIKSAAFAQAASPDISVEAHNIMGISVPRITATKVSRTAQERGYGIGGTSSRIDEACRYYEIVVEKALIAAETETVIRRILTEIERTKRRVNALEFKILPDLEEARRVVQTRLNERERESLFVVKRIKKTLKK
jgi:V/A-type H+-transporting ATPase subunit D